MSPKRKVGVSYFLPLIFLAILLALAVGLSGPQRLAYREEVVVLGPDLSPEFIANLLYQKGLIWNQLHFIQEARAQHLEAFFKGGEYFLCSDLGVPEIVRKLKEHEVIRYKLIIPEGATVSEIADRLSKTPLLSVENTVSPTSFVDREKFLRLALEQRSLFSGSFLYQNTTSSLEGYLFPDTYILPRMSEEEAIQAMIDNLEKKVKPEWLDRARKMGWSFHEVLTLASMIEKEAGVEDEKPIISSVFHNRLDIGMKLECDPTVEYALGYHKQPLSWEELNFDSPYNTYLYHGLPPGPICNPGLSSMEAALYPEDTEYYYFVAKGDGRHLFASTYEEHLENIARVKGE